MRAIVVHEFGDERSMKVQEISVPEVENNEVKIRVHAAGLNPNEVYVLTGNYAFFVPDLPFIPGFDAAGVVEEVGSEVTHLYPGDRVYVGALSARQQHGSYAEYMVADASYVHALPEHLSFSQGAALGIPADAAFRALFTIGHLQKGETVFIHGASGGAGQFAVQMAKAAAAKVIGTASSEEGRQIIRNLGADYALEHLRPGELEDLMDVTEGRGPDLIIEFLANINLATDMDAIARQGRIVVVGNRGEIEINPRRLMEKESEVRGMAVTHQSLDDRKIIDREIGKFIEGRKITPVIGKEYGLDEMQQAHKDLLNRKSTGKLVLRIAE